MNMIKTAIAAAALAFALSTGAAVAQTATGTTPATKTEISAKCSKDADDKKLHGKERKKFRESCMKAAKAAAAPATTTMPAKKN
jgi:hypothetical protein